MDRLNGRVVLITGAAQGIGAATARAMAHEGAKVVVADLQDDAGKALSAELDAIYVRLDVTDPEAWARAVQVTLGRYGRLDVLVNNAGIAAFASIETLDHDTWNRVLAIDIGGTFNGIKASITALRAAGGGSIINMSSISGIQGVAGLSAYVTAKFGIRGLTKSAALELGRDGIRVNSVHPGVIRTPATAISGDRDYSHVALGRPGEPEEIASLLVFLASDESRFSTGAEFVADGGELAGSALPITD